MPVITLVRHAQSEAQAKQNQDMYDPGITNLGKEQASNVEGHFDLVIISTLKRTKETLEHSKVKTDILFNLLLFNSTSFVTSYLISVN